MSIEKTFKPDWDYNFWFYKHKFAWVMEMLDLIYDYEFADGEIEGMLLDVEKAKQEKSTALSGGMHYGKKGTMYLGLKLDEENSDIVHVVISTSKKFEAEINFLDLLQCKYDGVCKV
jgi:hypothetical protein